MARPRIVIAGAGSIGCFVGGLLAHAGQDVSLLGRPAILDPLRANGLRLTDFAGLNVQASPRQLSDDPAILAQADLILVTVKSGATAEMGRLIAQHGPMTAPVISLQNGIENAATLTAALPGYDVRAGMVPFNVVPQDPGQYRRTTSGEIVIEAGPGDWASVLSSHALPIVQSDQIRAVQWGKLLLNLTNAVNALSGLPLLEMLRQRAWRQLMADQMAEALRVLDAARIPVRSTAPVAMSWVPLILRLPTPLYRRIAAKMLTIDPQARTSMAYDLMAGRATELDQLQGAILTLARQNDLPAPTVASLYRAIRSLEGQGPISPAFTPARIRAM